MRVKDIIAESGSVWIPGREYGLSTPKLSILLPTFRRARDGLFRRALMSILSQSLDAIEVIVVDDASKDGTADIIDEVMREDGRVSCIRHTHNMGLPAISEFEAFLKATAPVIGFAFDDFVYEPDALGSLLNLMSLRRCDAIHGQGWMWVNNNDVLLGDATVAHDRLLQHNFIANGTVLVSRAAINMVGLYDPHILLSRLCDWDLWIRLSKNFSFESVSLLVGREYGASRSDSLGNTYPLQFEVVQEFMGSHRDCLLTPESFLERDVLSVPVDASYILKQAVDELCSFFSSKNWFLRSKTRSALTLGESAQERKLVVVVGSLTASLSSYWVGESGSEVSFYTLVDTEAPEQLAFPLIVRSSLVIFVRDIFLAGQQKMLKFCREINIPHIFFADDDISIIVKAIPELAPNALGAFRKELRSFSGVIVSSTKLLTIFRDMCLHQNIENINPIFIDSQFEKMKRAVTSSKRKPIKLNLGYFGKTSRHSGLIRTVVPALKQLQGSSRLFTPPVGIDFSAENVEHLVLPHSPFYFHFLQTWSKSGISVVAYPADDKQHVDFGAEGALITALYLGAVPVVTGEAAYVDYDVDVGVEKIRGDVSDWCAAFERLRDPEYHATMLTRLETLCRKKFTSRAAEHIVGSYLEEISTLGSVEMNRRHRSAFSISLNGFQNNAFVESRDMTEINTSGNHNKIAKITSISSCEEGHLDDVIGGHTVKGWAYWDMDANAELILRIDDLTVGTFHANLFRPDLLLGGKGNGFHAFLVPIPRVFLDGHMHTVSVAHFNSQNELVGSPRNVLLGNK